MTAVTAGVISALLGKKISEFTRYSVVANLIGVKEKTSIYPQSGDA
ncbi:hypothetical protein M8542_43205 [Amycolatopsis sp. OK19-0408]|uniref:Uncharacterized protein n=1 Tax=Amycolatopsis iheyensis TaxID=2945988 RepID=A0A9X2NPU0_9PSEU|nr:hypothetical protein [Amycolatopsis iheyensis]MCR6489645.1 hypothetical protein [Amycolatopsis iheyensis]